MLGYQPSAGTRALWAPQRPFYSRNFVMHTQTLHLLYDLPTWQLADLVYNLGWVLPGCHGVKLTLRFLDLTAAGKKKSLHIKSISSQFNAIKVRLKRLIIKCVFLCLWASARPRRIKYIYLRLCWKCHRSMSKEHEHIHAHTHTYTNVMIMIITRPW